MYKNYLNNLIVLVGVGLVISCAYSNPSHKIPVRLDVEFFINVDNKLCFNPDFTTANISSKPYNLDEISNVFYSLDLISQNELIPIWEDNLPKEEKYRGLPICSDESVNDLLNINNEYAFCLRGMEPKGNYNVVACPGFIYYENNLIKIEKRLSSE